MTRVVTNFFLLFFVLGLSACNIATCEKETIFATNMRPSTDCEQNIIAEVNKAQQMDIAVYSISNIKIVDSLINAFHRGAQIRIITDRTQAKGKGSLVEKLKSAGIPVVTNKKTKIEHNKYAIFDNKHVVSGSYNWTENASKFNSENCVFFDQLSEEYSHRFDYLWNLYQE